MFDLTIVIPTFNERQNIGPMVAALDACLEGKRWEVLFVDDNSPDRTYEEVAKIAMKDERVRLLHRIGRRGLSSACIEGMLTSTAPLLAVMDADFQHDQTILLAMIDKVENETLELVIASRYMQGGSTGGGLSRARLAISRLATRASNWFSGCTLTDPMSGFFLLKHELLTKTQSSLSGEGFKILIDLVITAGPDLRFGEVPYIMKPRAEGESKLSVLVALEFLLVLISKRTSNLLPVRFMMFVMVGMSGVVVHLSILTLLVKISGCNFLLSQSIATIIAMTSNFFLNNILTYSDRQLGGSDLINGLFSFYIACGLGAIINVALANFLFSLGWHFLLTGFAGAMAGAVWNYLATRNVTWRQS